MEHANANNKSILGSIGNKNPHGNELAYPEFCCITIIGNYFLIVTQTSFLF